MDQDVTEDGEEIPTETREFILDLLELDYDEGHHLATLMAWGSLTTSAKQLIQCKDGPTEDEIKDIVVSVTASPDTDGILLHDDVLMPAWSQFSESLSAVRANDRGFIHLIINRIHLDQSVLDMLLQAFKTAPVKVLSMLDNDLGCAGLKFIASAIKVIPELEGLNLIGNRIDSEQDAASLVDSLLRHPTIDALVLSKCNIGSNDTVMDSILPALELNAVRLENNGIGSYGACLISDSLALNPMVSFLNLEGNLLQDAEAKMIAKSLKSNTNLTKLCISGNRFTKVGTKAFYLAVTGLVSLDAIHSSNHTCFIEIKDDTGDDDWCLGMLSKTNICVNPVVNKKIKLWVFLRSSVLSYYFLDDFPIKIMPRVLYFLQGEGFMNLATHNGLNSMFQLLREWSMPLLYTNRIGHEVRRSDRLRRKEVLQLRQIESAYISEVVRMSGDVISKMIANI